MRKVRKKVGGGEAEEEGSRMNPKTIYSTLVAVGSALWFLAAGMSDAGGSIVKAGVTAAAGGVCLASAWIADRRKRND